MATKDDNTLNILDQLLSNEQAGVPTRNTKEPYSPPKKKTFTKKETVVLTDNDLTNSGWNLKFDFSYQEPYVVGQIVDGIRIVKVGSLYNMACVYSSEFWTYGWGVNVSDAISDCRRSIEIWKTNNPGKTPPKKKDVSVADVLNKEGL